jgi:hypothetical protein
MGSSAAKVEAGAEASVARGSDGKATAAKHLGRQQAS